MEVFIRTNHDTVEDTARAIIRTLYDTSRSWRTQQCPRAKPDNAGFQNSVSVECSASYFTDVLSRLRVNMTETQRALLTSPPPEAFNAQQKPAAPPHTFAFRVDDCGMVELTMQTDTPQRGAHRTPRSYAQAFGLQASYADSVYSPCGYAAATDTSENAALSLYNAAAERAYQHLNMLNAMSSDRQTVSNAERAKLLEALCVSLSETEGAARGYYSAAGKPFKDYPLPNDEPVFNGVVTNVLTLRSVYSILGFSGQGRAEQTHSLLDMNGVRVRISTLYDVYTPHMPVVLTVDGYGGLKVLFPLTLRRADDSMSFVRI